ncbi:MAG: heme biosynthesis HemY N-terminal domain-containing protein [Pseudomonadota bacterium]
MKYLLWIIGLFAVAVALAIASRNPAYVQLVYPPYRIEVSLTMFIMLTLLTFVLGYWLVRLISSFLNLPDHVRQFRLERAQTRARKLLDEMLGAFFEGRYADAEKAAGRAIESGQTSAIHPIIAARSAHELHEFEKRDAYLAAAEGRKTGDATMRLMATTKFMLDEHDTGAALEALRELRESGVKNHPGAMSLELKAQQQAGNWDEVLKLLDKLEKHQAVDATAAAELRQQAWLNMIRQQEDLAGLTACLKNVPADIRRLSMFAAAAARELIKHGGCEQAQKLLTDSLNAQWDSELVALYGDCQTGELVAQIEQAEKWLRLHDQDAGLLLALGKLCIRQKLWGKAQSYLDASISLTPSRAAYEALGWLAELLGKSDDASRYYQQAMAVTKQ